MRQHLHLQSQLFCERFLIKIALNRLHVIALGDEKVCSRQDDSVP
jgi:hypothetical protein